MTNSKRYSSTNMRLVLTVSYFIIDSESNRIERQSTAVFVLSYFLHEAAGIDHYSSRLQLVILVLFFSKTTFLTSVSPHQSLTTGSCSTWKNSAVPFTGTRFTLVS